MSLGHHQFAIVKTDPGKSVFWLSNWLLLAPLSGFCTGGCWLHADTAPALVAVSSTRLQPAGDQVTHTRSSSGPARNGIQHGKHRLL